MSKIYDKVVSTRNYENLHTYLGGELGDALYAAVQELRRLERLLEKKPKPKRGPATAWYRILGERESLRKNDEYRGLGGRWHKVSDSAAGKWVGNCTVYRRPLFTLRFKKLKPGTMTVKGDETTLHGIRTAVAPGYVIEEWDCREFRRPYRVRIAK